MIGKFGELSYHMKKNSTKWNSRAERGCRTATSSMRASAHPPEGFLYDREVRRTFLSYEKSCRILILDFLIMDATASLTATLRLTIPSLPVPYF